ncbi:hypothetical protein DSM19430T_33330 [Desulfovibrio psychrotolerans]|uniref:Uncharacterized protein n=2 Tax=Desulfovibrio psychrotolerans TaxID=415242 RepID=A0A7J0BY80_9BACT|nr:hypothetical protein DSM19430T_33330 [Desulfovibrio psychrotolerans]
MLIVLHKQAPQFQKILEITALAPARLRQEVNFFLREVGRAVQNSKKGLDLRKEADDDHYMSLWIMILSSMKKIERDANTDLLTVTEEELEITKFSAYLISKCKGVQKDSVFILKSNKIPHKQSRKISKLASSVYINVSEFFIRKTFKQKNLGLESITIDEASEIGSNISVNYMMYYNSLFWHREFVKRKFYIDVHKDSKLKYGVSKILKHICSLAKDFENHPHDCFKCLFENDKLFWIYFDSYVPHKIGCYGRMCFINKKIAIETLNFELDKDSIINKEEHVVLCKIFKKYKMMFTDLSFKEYPTLIAEHINEGKSIPFYGNINDFIKDEEIGNLYTKSIGGINMPKTNGKHETAAIEYIKKQKKDIVNERHIINDESNTVGLWIWDTVNILKSDNNVSGHIKKLITEEVWYRKFSTARKYAHVLKEYTSGNKNIDAESILKDITREHRYDYYRVDESIRSGILLSTEEALTRRRERTKKNEAKSTASQ